jgi:hypothetical protein
MVKGFRKKFCIRGHDKDKVGRYSDGSCGACRRMLNKAKYIKKIRSSICKRGHDTAICGRTPSRACRECVRLLDRKPRQICSNGHDTVITGRYKNGRCVACSKLPSKQFCVNRHNTFITGRDKTGHCKVCVARTQRKREKIRRKTDINFRVACALRCRLKSALKENWKTGSAVRDLGCTIDFLIAYLQEQFYDSKMSWDNWGTYWEIDHIKELHTFDLTNRKQLLKAVNYKNLQPLTIPDHINKSIKTRGFKKALTNKKKHGKLSLRRKSK